MLDCQRHPPERRRAEAIVASSGCCCCCCLHTVGALVGAAAGSWYQAPNWRKVWWGLVGFAALVSCVVNSEGLQFGAFFVVLLLPGAMIGASAVLCCVIPFADGDTVEGLKEVGWLALWSGVGALCGALLMLVIGTVGGMLF